jgi:DNA-binding PadR family transcriptional regulator
MAEGIIAGERACRSKPDHTAIVQINHETKKATVHYRLTLQAAINYIAVLMTQVASLGEFEQVVLLAILRLSDNAYGVTIRSEIAACTGREPAPGALYTTLDRMEKKGAVRSWLGDATPQRGGRAKRYFALTKAGRAALISVQRGYRRLLAGLDLLGGANV